MYGGINCIKMVDLAQEPESKTPVFVYDYMPCIETKQLMPSLTDFDIRLYIYKIL